uniref:Uncharacterized protein n=1 Tax=Leersia perrieri TaxID=77586 RepID=A0A0D9V078_9ORYZ
MRRSIRSRIRISYIEAIRRLPAAGLRTTLAQGVLVGGHCYGPPLKLPVHNILLNSIWYAAAFPLAAEDRIDVPIITANSLSRVVLRSLDGLIASLRHRCPSLSHDAAISRLYYARDDDVISSACTGEAAAFRVAAEAAQHPKPAAMAHFLRSVLPAVARDAESVLDSNMILSSDDILRLSATLAPSPLPDEVPQPPLRERRSKIVRIINDRRNNYKCWYEILLRLADAALREYAQQTGEQYELHTIYGETFLEDFDEPANYVHINFMASPSSCQDLQASHACFFAEVLVPPRVKRHEGQINLCCLVHPLPDDTDSCHGCLIENHIIDHPKGVSFCGKKHYEMDGNGYDWDWPSTADVDYRFFDPDKDVGLVEYLDGAITHAKAVRSLSTRNEDDSDDSSDDDDISSYSMQFV